MKRILFTLIPIIFIGLQSCEKQETFTIETIGYEVKGWSSSKTSKTSKSSTTKFVIEMHGFNQVGQTPNGHNLYEMLLTSGTPESNDYEVFGSVVYHIDQEGMLIISTNQIGKETIDGFYPLGSYELR